MIRLRDTTRIAVPPARVWAWLDTLPSHYREWHPAHIACRYERGTTLEPGAVLYVEERLHGRVHRLRLHATEVVRGRLLRYRSRGFTGAFRVEPADGGTRFTAELNFGTAAPLLGTLLDAALRRLLARQLAAFQVHLREEGENLKRLLEAAPNE